MRERANRKATSPGSETNLAKHRFSRAPILEPPPCSISDGVCTCRHIVFSDSAAVAQQQQFDGQWSVGESPKGSLQTDAPLSGRDRQGDHPQQRHEREGRVREGGRIQGSIEIRRSRAEVAGSLSERSGPGPGSFPEA